MIVAFMLTDRVIFFRSIAVANMTTVVIVVRKSRTIVILLATASSIRNFFSIMIIGVTAICSILIADTTLLLSFSAFVIPMLVCYC